MARVSLTFLFCQGCVVVFSLSVSSFVICCLEDIPRRRFLMYVLEGVVISIAENELARLLISVTGISR